MIIENAFLKLPELLTSNLDHADTFEATVVHLLAVAVQMELNSRNIPRTFEHVYTEKPYPARGEEDRPIRADLFVRLEGAVPTHGRMPLYGTREVNWIEAKAFLSSTRRGSAPPKTANAGKILRDLLRLSLLPKELQGTIRQNGRYLLVIFDKHPSAYVAFASQNEERIWISHLFSEGHTDIQIDLSKEPDSLRNGVGPGFVQWPNLKVNMKLRILMFEPEDTVPSPVFWGYLIRIRYFRITVPDWEIEYEDKPGQSWDNNRIDRLVAVRREVLKRTGSAEEE